MMGKAHLAGAGQSAATDQGNGGDGVMRGAERSGADQGDFGEEQASHTVELSSFVIGPLPLCPLIARPSRGSSAVSVSLLSAPYGEQWSGLWIRMNGNHWKEIRRRGQHSCIPGGWRINRGSTAGCHIGNLTLVWERICG